MSRNERVQIWLDVACRLQQYFGGEIAIRRNCDQAPFSPAASMRSIPAFLMDIMDPENEILVHELLEYCTRVTTQFIALMAQVGVPIVSNPAGRGA